MRVLRVQYQGKNFYAALIKDQVMCLDKTLGLDQPIALTDIIPLPTVTPTKVVCAAVNYRPHAEEIGWAIPDEPVIFFKPPTAVIGTGHSIILPQNSARVDYEGELAVIIGKTCRYVAPQDVPSYIFGYACANDVTARDFQKKDGLFGRAKGFDTFCPIGPWIETEVDDVNNLRLTTSVNGEVKQEGNTSDMIFDPFTLVSFISTVMTLNPGDAILTGTPSGIGPLTPGDEVHVEIEGVGLLSNSVVLEEDALASTTPVQ
ncbi:fumarylacetoacetate hydrolase family protein [Desulfovibrio inopinatus]|uniref:fumarylacetoacetate hydrolase family protein n=1 Tax=Desulfovibrio inopinatus TaxID=102109 RepID=UPI000417D5DB|nr:fumarylacetoacetate hydrolase family protein [Desulfovibrio inopinatus]